MKKRTRKLLSVILAAVCILSAGLYLRYQLDYSSGDDAYSDAEALAMQTEATVPSEETVPEETTAAEPYWAPVPVEDDPNVEELAKKKLTTLRKLNEDVVAWIWIPDTVVNYPVMQGEDNNFYLEHTWNREENAVGSIFLEWQNAADFSEFNTIVYGHNMKNGSMFHLLLDYQKEGFLQEHPYVYLLTDNGVYRYEVFSAYQAEITSDTYQIGMQWDKTKQEYIDRALKKSVVDAGLTPVITDRILTLSTCAGLGGALGMENRWVVHAYLPMEFVE